MTDIATVRALLPITLSARDGISLTLTPLGARMTGLWAPDRAGTLADIVLGHDRAEDYLTPHGYIGATCGRYGNRIAGAASFWTGSRRRLTATKARTSCTAARRALTCESGRSPRKRPTA